MEISKNDQKILKNDQIADQTTILEAEKRPKSANKGLKNDQKFTLKS